MKVIPHALIRATDSIHIRNCSDGNGGESTAIRTMDARPKRIDPGEPLYVAGTAAERADFLRRLAAAALSAAEELEAAVMSA